MKEVKSMNANQKNPDTTAEDARCIHHAQPDRPSMSGQLETKLDARYIRTEPDPVDIYGNFAYYLQLPLGDDISATGRDAWDALVSGYVCALRVNQVYEPAIFLTGSELNAQLLEDYKAVRQRLTQIAPHIVSILHQFSTNKTTNQAIYTSSTPSMAFAYGYLFGFHKLGRYTPLFFEDGIALRTHILNDLLINEINQENAARTRARIVIKRYGLKKEQLRAMVFDQASIDDEGKPVDGRPIRSLLIEEGHIDDNGEPTITEHVENGRIIPDTVPDYSERFMGGEADAPVERILYVAPDIAAAIAEDMQARGLEVSPEIAAAAEEARKQNLNDDQPIPNEGDVIHGGGSLTHIDTITDPA